MRRLRPIAAALLAAGCPQRRASPGPGTDVFAPIGPDVCHEPPIFDAVEGSGIIERNLPRTAESFALQQSDVDQWKLDRLILFSGICFFPNAPRSTLLLPAHAEITSLGTHMLKVDRLYRQKGLITPSEMATVFFPIIPTFLVELRHVYNAVPSEVAKRFQDLVPMSQFPTYLSKYPFLFKLHRARFSKTAVTLNDEFDFVRHHPLYGRGDRLQRRHNISGMASHGALRRDGTLTSPDETSRNSLGKSASPDSTTATQLDAKHISVENLNRMPPAERRRLIFQVLLRNLLAASKRNDSETADTSSYNWVPLSLWINSFTAEDLAVVNTISPLECLSLIGLYCNVFLLGSFHTGDDAVFCPKSDPSVMQRLAVSAAARDDSTQTGKQKLSLSDDLIGLDALAEEESHRDDHGSQSNELLHKLDRLQICFKPPSVAPRSLSDFNTEDSPDKDIVLFVKSLLPDPPSAPDSNCAETLSDISHVWRWVPLDFLYNKLSKADLTRIRTRYKTMANFLRMHGQVFQVSVDLRHVITYSRHVRAPLVPTQNTFCFEERVSVVGSDGVPTNNADVAGNEEREHFRKILGDALFPTTRQQLMLLDPHNPILRKEVVEDELYYVLPPYPERVPLIALRKMLPPLLRAVMGRNRNLSSFSRLRHFEDQGMHFIQRVPSATDIVVNNDISESNEAASSSLEQSAGASPSVEAAIAELYESLPACGATIAAIRRLHLSTAADETLQKQYGSLPKALASYPHLFRCEQGSSSTTSVYFSI